MGNGQGAICIILPFVEARLGQRQCPRSQSGCRSDRGKHQAKWSITSQAGGFAFKGLTVVLGPPRHGLEWLGMDPGVRGRGHTVPPRRHRPSGLFPLRPLVAGAKRSHGRRGIQFAIWRYDSRWTLVGTGATSDINTGTAWNTIKVVRDGDDISLYVNGIFQTMISDDALTDFLRIG